MRTPAEYLAAADGDGARAIELFEADRHAEYDAEQAAIVPHVRKPNDRSKLSRHAAASPHNRVPIGAEITGTYCGAPITTRDVMTTDVRSEAARARRRAEGTCAACLAIVEARSR